MTRFGGWKAFQACFWLIHRRPTCLWTIWLHSLGYFLAMVDITFWICFFLHSSHGGGQIPLRISGAIPKKNNMETIQTYLRERANKLFECINKNSTVLLWIFFNPFGSKEFSGNKGASIKRLYLGPHHELRTYKG